MSIHASAHRFLSVQMRISGEICNSTINEQKTAIWICTFSKSVTEFQFFVWICSCNTDWFKSKLLFSAHPFICAYISKSQVHHLISQFNHSHSILLISIDYHCSHSQVYALKYCVINCVFILVACQSIFTHDLWQIRNWIKIKIPQSKSMHSIVFELWHSYVKPLRAWAYGRQLTWFDTIGE